MCQWKTLGNSQLFSSLIIKFAYFFLKALFSQCHALVVMKLFQAGRKKAVNLNSEVTMDFKQSLIHVAICGRTIEVDHFFQMQNKTHREECSVPLCKSKQAAETLFAAPITYLHFEGLNQLTERSSKASMASQKYKVKRFVNSVNLNTTFKHV